MLVGANNCGKSNVLRGLELLGRIKDPFGRLSEIDRHHRDQAKVLQFVFAAEPIDSDFDKLKALKNLRFIWTPDGRDDLRVTESSFGDLPWKDFYLIRQHFINGQYSRRPDSAQIEADKLNLAARLTSELWNANRAIAVVPQFREIREGDAYTIAGGGIVKLLARWHHPEIGQDADHKKFLRIQSLLEHLIEVPDVTLEVSHKQDHIIVKNGVLRLPLSSYGTGIHELIILAIAVLSHDKTVVCIEEPEIHLHPLLQRRFLEFLRKETTNRYVITTHSPALIVPNADTAVTHLWLENGITKSRLVETNGHSLEALRDLGAKASDLLQANSVIWVEGPSDRIYLKRWLELLHPDEFREGIDYSIMFYGGRLLAHVSLERDDVAADPDDTDDLVRLLQINQHSAVLIDSDRRKKTTPLNATKLRVQQECARAKVLCWITDGREIENYLASDAVATAYAELSGTKPDFKLRLFDDIESSLEHALRKTWSRANYYNQSKPQMARRIARHLSKEGLSPRLLVWLEKIVGVIRHQNR